MKITGLAMMAMVGSTVLAEIVPADERQIMVCIGSPGDIPSETRFQAKAVASDIFAGIGVNIRWQHPSDCSKQGILITFSDQTPASLMRGALAYALPYEGTHIVVFYDRVKNKPGRVSILLGHVIAHEITHILQGMARHSESGVMKAAWTGADYQQMTLKPLQFTDEDVILIHDGLRARESNFAAVAVAGRAPVAP